MKLLFKIFFSISIIYISIWAYNNVDFRSLFCDSKNLIKYEFQKDNFLKSADSLITMLQKHFSE